MVEIADTSLRFDQTVELLLYAQAGIPELWIVDLKGRVLTAYRKPSGGQYAEATTHQPGDQLTLTAAPEITVTLNLIFG